MATPDPVPSVVWFTELSLDDEDRVGGKGANLGELTRAGFPVPPGFVITAGAFLTAMEQGGVRAEMAEGTRSVDPDDAASLEAMADRLRSLVHKAGIPAWLRDELATGYVELRERVGQDADVVVAVRSSPAAFAASPSWMAAASSVCPV